jgi:hypothetical protein
MLKCHTFQLGFGRRGNGDFFPTSGVMTKITFRKTVEDPAEDGWARRSAARRIAHSSAQDRCGGYEKFLFEGASRTLEKVSFIYFEPWDRHFSRYGHVRRDVINLPAKKGFTLSKLVGNESVVPAEDDHSSITCENLVAVRELKHFLERTQFHLTA